MPWVRREEGQRKNDMQIERQGRKKVHKVRYHNDISGCAKNALRIDASQRARNISPAFKHPEQLGFKIYFFPN